MTTQNQSQASDSESKCRFCGNSPNDVRTMLVSSESAICDRCVITALHTISHQQGHFHLRIAFLVFRAVASIGQFLTPRST
ncbi:MAG TPA: ClpX C4-type zinc finger protein, partial [Candidatus Binatus sp.]|nr:ClpX C4-type zinc finger protein [Candidatus Binatus sp.]